MFLHSYSVSSSLISGIKCVKLWRVLQGVTVYTVCNSFTSPPMKTLQNGGGRGRLVLEW